MKKLICLFVLGVSVLAFTPSVPMEASEVPRNVTVAENEAFKWGKYYTLPDVPFEIAVNSYKKHTLDVKVRDDIEGTTRLKIIPARRFAYIYKKDINQFGGWRCVAQTRYEEVSFIEEIAHTAISILKESGVLSKDEAADE